MLNRKFLLSALLVVASSVAAADFRGQAHYEVSITNITPGQTFTPILVAGHGRALSLFELGEPASEPLAILAEGGDTAPLSEVLTANHAKDVQTIPGLLEPGKTSTVTVSVPRKTALLSLAAMLIPTNDTFVSLNGVKLPKYGKRTYYAKAYDAGSEVNDQSCANMPWPRCGGEGVSPAADSDEGFVSVSNGFHELGDFDSNGAEVLHPQVYDWRNPVAKITIKRLTHYGY